MRRSFWRHKFRMWIWQLVFICCVLEWQILVSLAVSSVTSAIIYGFVRLYSCYLCTGLSKCLKLWRSTRLFNKFVLFVCTLRWYTSLFPLQRSLLHFRYSKLCESAKYFSPHNDRGMKITKFETLACGWWIMFVLWGVPTKPDLALFNCFVLAEGLPSNV